MARMNYNHLFNFYVVAKSGSLKGAAINLGLKQSTLSEQMKALESSIGKRLFSRIGRNLTLSAEGRQLFERVENFYAETADLGSEKNLRQISSRDCVEIGVTTTISRVFTYEILRRIFQKTGSLIRITESTGDTLMMAFQKQEIDVFITHEKLSRSLVRRVKSVSLKKPELLLVGTSDFASLSKNFPKGLNDQEFFLFTIRSQLRWEIEKFFRANNINPKIKSEVDDPELLKAAVLDGLGIAVLPEHSVSREISENKLIVLGKIPAANLDIYAHYLDGEISEDLLRVIRVMVPAKSEKFVND